jgi:hypothetical protein
MAQGAFDGFVGQAFHVSIGVFTESSHPGADNEYISHEKGLLH